MDSKNNNTNKKPNVHAGHRDRMRKRFEEAGFNNFQAHEALEMLLYYCIPQRDTNEIAHDLLNHFGNSISAVFNASVQELTSVSYISYNTAILIKMIPEFMRMYIDDRNSTGEYIKSSDDAKNFFKGKLFGHDEELFMIVYLDNNNKIISCEILERGAVNSAKVDMNKIVKGAITKKAASCIVAHNHPKGLPFASQEDLTTTKKIITILDQISVTLKDHIISGENAIIALSEHMSYGEMFMVNDRLI